MCVGAYVPSHFPCVYELESPSPFSSENSRFKFVATVSAVQALHSLPIFLESLSIIMGFTLKSLTVAVVWSIATRSCMGMPIPSSISRRAIRDASYIPRQYLQGLPKLTTIADVASSNIAEPVSDDKWHMSSRKAVGDIDSGVNKDYIDYSSAGYFPRSSDEDTDNGRFAVPVDYRRNSQGRGSTLSVSDHMNTGYAARYDGPLSPASDGKLLNLLPESLRKGDKRVFV